MRCRQRTGSKKTRSKQIRHTLARHFVCSSPCLYLCQCLNASRLYSAVTLLLSEKRSRIASLFWARFLLLETANVSASVSAFVCVDRSHLQLGSRHNSAIASWQAYWNRKVKTTASILRMERNGD